MSIWWRTKDERGTVHYVAIDISYLGLVVVFAVLLAFLLPAIAAAQYPALLLSLWCTVLGFAAFATAKLSVILRGRLVSFGSGPMTSPMKFLYRFGYTGMALGGVLGLLAYLVSGSA